MASRAATIADALVSFLNDPARTWDLGFTAERTWDPLVDLKDLAELSVLVAPDDRSKNELIARNLRQRDYTVWVDVRQKYPDTGKVPNDWADERAALVEAIDDAIIDLTLSSQPTGYRVWVLNSSVETLCDAIDLKQEGLFTGIIEVTFRETRPR